MKNNPLVSIIIITYNSSKYVLETLESAKNQTYKNIELIISDDCSTDNTCDIANDFILQNEQFFTKSKLVRADKNTGISGNCNRGVLASKGRYIKMIAGDDLLTENCISDYVNFFQSNEEIKIAASKTKIFYENDITKYQIWPKEGEFLLGLAKQKLEILKANFVYNVSIFFTRDLYDTVNGFDERYPMIEDYPFDYKVIYAGYPFYFLDEVTVNYRVNFDSTTRPLNQNKFVNEVSHTNACIFIKSYILPELKSHKMYIWWLLRWGKVTIINCIIKNGNNINSINNIFNRKILFLVKYLSGKLRKFENRL